MKATEVKFQELLNGKLQYRVPLFQRTYSWGEKQWDQLWDDILELYRMPTPRRHFIGSVVTQPIPDAPVNAAKHMLIDGQQRMTTLLLLLAVIKALAQRDSEDSNLAEEIEETCLKNKFVNDPDEQFKLKPTKRDQEAFEQALAGQIPSSDNRVGEAWVWFSNMLAKHDSDGQPIILRRLKDRITSYLDLVSITLETDDSPNRIFESLNNTGARLEASDLVRNYLFMRIPIIQHDKAYDNIWFPMQERLKESIDDFFWRYSMKDGDLTRWDDIFDDTMRKLRDSADDQMVDALEKFSTFSTYYARIKWPEEHEKSEAIRDRLIRLNQWEVDVSYPFLLKVLDLQARGQISGGDVVNILNMIESFVVRRTICGVPTNRLRRIFAGLASQCRAYDDLVKSCRNYLSYGDNHWPNDIEFRRELIGYRLYNTARLARTRVILDSLETSFGNKEAPKLDGKMIQVEHVMPQTITASWECMLGDEATRVHSQWLHTIGNLTLTGYDPELSNKPFNEKKKLLEKANFQLTVDDREGVLLYDKWNEDSVKARAELLADRAIKIWSR